MEEEPRLDKVLVPSHDVHTVHFYHSPAKLYVVILKTERSNFIDQEIRRLRNKNVTKQKQRPVSNKSCASSKGLVPSAGEVPRPLILTRRLTVFRFRDKGEETLEILTVVVHEAVSLSLQHLSLIAPSSPWQQTPGRLKTTFKCLQKHQHDV